MCRSYLRRPAEDREDEGAAGVYENVSIILLVAPLPLSVAATAARFDRKVLICQQHPRHAITSFLVDDTLRPGQLLEHEETLAGLLDVDVVGGLGPCQQGED